MGQDVLTHAWINAVLGLVTGLLMVSFNRWPHMGWLITHVFLAAGSNILLLGVPALLDPVQIKLLQMIGYLVFLGAVTELTRATNGSMPRWSYPAALVIIAAAFWPDASGAMLFLPRIVLYGGTALAMGRAIRGRNLPLFALAFMSFGQLVSDGLKALAVITPHPILTVQPQIDVWWTTAAWSLFLGGILWPELEVLVRETALLRHTAFIDQPLPARAGKSIRDIARIGQEINDLDRFMQNAAVASSLTAKEYYSLEELAVFLSAPESVARAFVENNGVRKIFPVGDPENWLVSRREVKEALLRSGFLGD